MTGYGRVHGALKTALLAALAVLVTLAGGCATRDRTDPRLPSAVTSISIDCNVLPLFADQAFDVVWNSRACQRLGSQMSALVREDRLPRSTPIAVTVALGSAYVFQDASTRPAKDTAWRAKNYAALSSSLPLLMTPDYAAVYERVETRLLRELSAPGKPIFDDERPGALWAQGFASGGRSLHLHLSLAGYYDSPNGAVQNLKMNTTLRDADGCPRASGGWLFDFSPEAIRTPEQVIDLVVERASLTLQSSTAQYEARRKDRRRTLAC